MIGRLRQRVTRELDLLVHEPLRLVELEARLLYPYRRLRFHSFGAKSVVHRPVWLYASHKMAIGERAVIVRSWLSVERTAWDADGPALQIGDGVVVRPFCAISAGESVVIEDNVGIGMGSTVIDADHLHGGPNDHFLFNPIATSPVRIGRGTWIGDRVAVLRGANIGCYCTIGANSVVRGEIPDYSVAVGAPARVIGSTRPA
jgi:acetyltransferase-like isoleucine patch superfamily enzyme